MASSRYEPYLPVILNWIRQTLEFHSDRKRSVSSFDFRRLRGYYSESSLHSASVVITDRLPVPPLSALGLAEFADFEAQPLSGITYQDVYFLQPDGAGSESLHFHELVHIVQWQVLGPRDFLLLYAAGLAQYGYRNCPLEVMAFDHQERFDTDQPPYSVEAEVRSQTLDLLHRQI